MKNVWRFPAAKWQARVVKEFESVVALKTYTYIPTDRHVAEDLILP